MGFTSLIPAVDVATKKMKALLAKAFPDAKITSGAVFSFKATIAIKRNGSEVVTAMMALQSNPRLHTYHSDRLRFKVGRWRDVTQFPQKKDGWFSTDKIIADITRRLDYQDAQRVNEARRRAITKSNEGTAKALVQKYSLLDYQAQPSKDTEAHVVLDITIGEVFYASAEKILAVLKQEGVI